MMRITGFSHLFKWENLHNGWPTKYLFKYCIFGIKDLYAFQFIPSGVVTSNELFTDSHR